MGDFSYYNLLQLPLFLSFQVEFYKLFYLKFCLEDIKTFYPCLFSNYFQSNLDHNVKEKY
jgi:hypothetical protein